MNVLLAEADVDYEKLKDLDEINPEFPQADTVLIVGANDVVNPVARTDTSSPIYGMPILDADKAASCIVLKRSMRPGFSGIDNPLYTNDRTVMVFGDAKDTLVELVAQVKQS
jgi:NAD(P) transhydrogenase subunit beta